MGKQRLQLTWYNKDKALIPTETGRYGYAWVEADDPRYCETHTLVMDEYVTGAQTPKSDDKQYSERADLEPQTDNLLIHGESGDVLEALTRVPELAQKYVGQVKLIYIDPPFNTEKTFSSYEDNLEHSIWLTMMRDRLLNLRRLLSLDGSIWVHLNNAEVHRMRSLLDEVFGIENFVSEVAWEKTFKPRNDATGFSSRHDVVLVYSRGPLASWNRLPRTASMDSSYANPDNDPNGAWTSAPATANHGDGGGGMCYAIQSPLTGEVLRPPLGGSWRFSQEGMLASLSEYAPYRLEDLHDEEWRANNEGVSLDRAKHGICALMLDCSPEEAAESSRKRIEAGNWPRVYITSKGGFRSKSYLATKPGRVPEDWWLCDEVGSNDEAKNEIKALSPGVVPFDTPKPERLLQRIIHIATNPGDIVLDCFGGSGTTAAVAQKMGRRWVMGELLDSNYSTYEVPRLTKVVNDEDPGGITQTKPERVADDGVELPDGLEPDDAAKFTSVLNKLIAEDPETFKADKTVKKALDKLKKMAKTKNSKPVINWRGGGGFQMAHLSPACFDYDPELGLVTLTEDAHGDTLVASICANRGFERLPEGGAFDGVKGSTYLKVYEGVADDALVDALVAQLGEGDKLVIAATSVMDGTREYLRRARRGSRVLRIPDEIFPFAGGDE